MENDEDIRWATETEQGLAFWRDRMETCRIKMLEAKNKFWLNIGKQGKEWTDSRDGYWTALDNWEAAKADLWRAKKEVSDHGPY